MKIAAYCRVSTDNEDQLNSLDIQKKFFAEYADKHGHDLVKIYADEGISGTKIKNRVEFKQLLSDASRGLFEMVVVKDISRFARNTVDLLNSTRKLKSLGIETTFLTANMTVLGQSEFVLTIFGALAQEESANTSKRVKFGKKLNAGKGRVPNLVYGYNKTKGDYFSLEIDKFESDVVRRIFKLYLTYGYGGAKIANILNSEGIRTKRGCKWSQNAICRILTNEIYIGKVINGKEEVTDFLTGKRKSCDSSDWYITDNQNLRIIDNTDFYAATKLMSERSGSFTVEHKRQSNKHLFSTVIRCSCCGYSFRRIAKRYKNTYIRWVCSNRNINGVDSCENSSKIDEGELKFAIKNYFTDILSQKSDVIKNIIKRFESTYHTKEENKDCEKKLSLQILRAEKIRNKYIEMYEDDLIPRAQLSEKLSALATEIEKAEHELQLVRYNLNRSDNINKTLQQTFKNLGDILDMDNMSNAQLKQVVDSITVDADGKIDVHLKILSDIGLA